MRILCEITCIFNFFRVNSETQSRYLVYYLSIVLGAISFQADTSRPSSVRIDRFFKPGSWLFGIRNRRNPPQVMTFERSPI